VRPRAPVAIPARYCLCALYPGRTQVESHQTHALGAYASAHFTVGVRHAYPSRPAPICAW
jgi:hypothetical protein